MFDTLGWKGKSVRHTDGREGIVVDEYINFDFCECTVKLTDGTRTHFTICAAEKDKDAVGWSWFCEGFDGGARWLEFGPRRTN